MYFSSEDAKQIMRNVKIGLWQIIAKPDSPAMIVCDEVTDDLLGTDETMTPEEKYVFFRSHIHPFDFAIFENFSLDVVSHQCEVTYRYHHPSKGERYVRCTGVRDSDVTDYILILGHHQDITDTFRYENEKTAEMRLASENEKLRNQRNYNTKLYESIVKFQPNGIVSYSLPERNVLVMNDMALKIYSLDEQSKYDKKTVLSRVAAMKYDNEEESLEKLNAIQNPGDHSAITMRMPQSDGSEMHLLVNTEMVEMDNTDRVIISSLQDISQLEEIQRTNRQLNEQLNIIKSLALGFDVIYYISLRDGKYLVIDENMNVTDNIAGAENIYSWFEKVIRNITDESRPDAEKFFDLSTVSQRLLGRNLISMQIEFRVRGWGEVFFISAGRNSDGETDHVVFALRNIDNEKKKEIQYQNAILSSMKDAEKANKAKTDFLFSMSHDIRTPMNAIIGYEELIEKNIDDREKTVRYLKNIRISGNLMLTILNNILEMAKIENRKETVELSRCSIHKLGQDIVSVFDFQLKRKGISLVTDFDIVHDAIMCDEVKIKQIFMNIISNSVKYTDEGGTIVFTCTETQGKVSGYSDYIVKISDSGRGISPEFLPHLFELFARERTVTESGVQGTGLGLSIVKNLVDLLDGSVDVASEYGKGTEFTIKLPLLTVSEDYLNTDGEKTDEKVSFDGVRILLAEDNEFNAEITSEMLKQIGVETDVACDGRQCVEMLKGSAPHYYSMILMDIQMPEINGYEAARLIRKMENPAYSQIPVIALTANGFREDINAAIESGMNGHLTKPVRMSDLIRTVKGNI